MKLTDEVGPPPVEEYKGYQIHKPGRPWYYAYPPGKSRATAQALSLTTLRRLIDRQLGIDPGPRALTPTPEQAQPTTPVGKLCACGCGEPVKSKNSKFRMGHNMRKSQ